MNERTAMPLRKPRCDERVLRDVMLGIWGYPAILAAHQMKLFELLADRSLTVEEVGARLKIARRGADTLLAVCASLGLVTFNDGRYSLTPLSEDYLLPSSPTYFGWFFDAWPELLSTWTPENIRKAAETDCPQGVFGDPQGPFAAWHGDFALAFTRAMHSASMAAALAWPECVDLSAHNMMLDVGGGSGAHSLGATASWPRLRAVILDREPVCAIAHRFAE